MRTQKKSRENSSKSIDFLVIIQNPRNEDEAMSKTVCPMWNEVFEGCTSAGYKSLTALFWLDRYSLLSFHMIDKRWRPALPSFRCLTMTDSLFTYLSDLLKPMAFLTDEWGTERIVVAAILNCSNAGISAFANKH